MSLMVASEDSTPSTAPIETLIVGEDKAREMRSAITPLSLSAAYAVPQRARIAISAKALRGDMNFAIRMTARC